MDSASLALRPADPIPLPTLALRDLEEVQNETLRDLEARGDEKGAKRARIYFNKNVVSLVTDMMERLIAAGVDAPLEPDLASYDIILINSSAGKDSQAMLDEVVQRARALGIEDRIVVVHSDLGKRVEWEGTRELAIEQADHYGARCIVVTRPQGDLLDQVKQRGMWPDSARRFCTSDHKRGQIRRVMTQLVDEVRAKVCADPSHPRHRELCGKKSQRRPIRILNCMGLRAQESSKRAKDLPFARDEKASNERRTVDTWLPIHKWMTDEVWKRIRETGVRYHSAYDKGMNRLSCAFCIFAPKAALLIAGKHNPEKLSEYVSVERLIGHKFKRDLALADIKAELDAGVQVDSTCTEDWCM